MLLKLIEKMHIYLKKLVTIVISMLNLKEYRKNTKISNLQVINKYLTRWNKQQLLSTEQKMLIELKSRSTSNRENTYKWIYILLFTFN